MAAFDRPVEVRPRGERGRRANQARDERRLRERHGARRFPEQVARHRLDAVDAAAQIDSIEIQLEDLRLGQLLLEQHREHGFLSLARRGALVREEQRARELLGQRAPTLQAIRAAHVPPHGPPQPDGIDPEMMVEAMILGRDHRVLEIRGDVVERHVTTLLVHPEPGAAIGGIEPRVADAPPQLEDGPSLAHGPHDRDCGQRDEGELQACKNAVTPGAGEDRQDTRARPAWAFSAKESTV